MALLEQFSFCWFHLVKLLSDGLVPVVLRPHFPTLGEGSNPALGAGDLATQVIVMGIHVHYLFMQLLHGLDTI